jgi:hypothetical protein
LTDEKPTPSEGASIEDRLVAMLSADDAPEQTKEPEAQAATPDPADTPADKPDSDAPSEETQPQLSTADLAKVFGVDPATFDLDDGGNVVVKLKADGKDLAPKLADLIQSYQVKGHADNKVREIAEQQRALQTRTQEAEQAFTQRLAQAEQLTKIAAEELLGEFQSIDWKALEQHPDRGAVADLKLKFQERNGKIQQALQGINAHKGQLSEQAKAQQTQRLAEEAERLPTLIPEWKDSTVRAKEQQDLIDWGLNAGYTPEQMKGLGDSTALHIATVRKAMLFDNLQKSKTVVENKVRLAPKIVKPGQPAQDTAASKARDLKQSVIKSGGKGTSIEAYLLATGKV